MSKLSDRTIIRLIENGELRIAARGSYIKPEQVQPASIDLRLGEISDKRGNKVGLEMMRKYWLPANAFMLGSTMETVGLSGMLVGDVKGKSTRAREGLMVECADLVDPGFMGELTLELKNLTDEPIQLDYGMLICQLVLDWMDVAPLKVYGPENGNHYWGQMGPTPARY